MQHVEGRKLAGTRKGRLVAAGCVIAAVTVLSLVLASRIAGTAHASTPCMVHDLASGCAPNYGGMTIWCSGSTVRYSTTTNSASHGNPAPGTYTKWLPNTTGQFVDGRSYCLGTMSSYWLLASSGWISRTLAS